MNLTRKYIIDETVFDTLNEESLYWLGYLYADGYVKHDKIYLGASEPDKCHIEKFRRFFKTDKPSMYRTPEESKRSGGYSSKNGTYFIWINSLHSGQLLELEYGFVLNRKGCVPKFLHMLNDIQLSYWLRGYMDGDGSIGKPFYDGKYLKYRIRFCTREDMGNFIISRLSDAHVCHTINMTKDKNHVGIVQLEYTGSPMTHSLAHYLYENANIYLERKFSMVKEYYW